MARSAAHALPIVEPVEQNHQWVLDVTLNTAQVKIWATGHPLSLTVTPPKSGTVGPLPLVVCASCYRLVDHNELNARCTGPRGH